MAKELTSIRLDPDLKRRAQQLASRKCSTLTGLITRLLVAELEKEGLATSKQPNGR